MKRSWNIRNVWLVTLALSLLGGWNFNSAKAADAGISAGSPPPADATAATNDPGADLPVPASLPSNIDPNSSLAAVIKLAQAGMSESVILSYVSNSITPFNLDSDEIIYLRDIGLSDNAISAMIQRDQSLGSTTVAQTTPPPETNTVTAPLTPPASETVPADDSYTYFYDSLAPYGSWIYVADYGYCWQPTVVVANPGWQPYCNYGRWVYTDCGWYWRSDYSWGWAPFHYGRWFHHPRRGWCWVPGHEWGPAWVSWRYNNDYCGWAPLPPGAIFRPGIGFTFHGRNVSASFGFGLSADFYTFVSFGHFTDHRPWEHRVPHNEHTRIYNNTTVVNNIVIGNNNTIINRGVGTERVEHAEHRPIRPIHVAENNDRVPPGGRHEHFEGGNTLVVNRPPLREHAPNTGHNVPHFTASPHNPPGVRHEPNNRPAPFTPAGANPDHHMNTPPSRQITPPLTPTPSAHAPAAFNPTPGNRHEPNSRAEFSQPAPAPRSQSPVFTPPVTPAHNQSPAFSAPRQSEVRTFHPPENPIRSESPRFNSPRVESQAAPQRPSARTEPTFPRGASSVNPPSRPEQSHSPSPHSNDGNHGGGDRHHR